MPIRNDVLRKAACSWKWNLVIKLFIGAGERFNDQSTLVTGHNYLAYLAFVDINCHEQGEKKTSYFGKWNKILSFMFFEWLVSFYKNTSCNVHYFTVDFGEVKTIFTECKEKCFKMMLSALW